MDGRMLISDSRLLLRYLNEKDDRAYGHLYEVYYPALKNLAAGFVKDEHVAADLVQDVFVSLLESAYHFERLDEVKYFLYRALKNRCIGYYRKQKVRSRYETEYRLSGNESEDFWEQVLEEDVYAQLFAAIRTLPPQCQRVMRLSLDGLKISEIAARLQISEDTVKEHKKNGKHKLSGLLKNSFLLALLFSV